MYLDPNFGGTIFQISVAAIASVGTVVFSVRRKIANIFRKEKRVAVGKNGEIIDMIEKQKKLVYVPMSVDVIHPGHINIIKIAAQHGRVVVGLLSDAAISTYKKPPLMDWQTRKIIIENIKGVDEVVEQEVCDFAPNIEKYRPDYVVHGTDWRTGPLADARAKTIELMATWGGIVIEPEYTTGISSSELKKKMANRNVG